MFELNWSEQKIYNLLRDEGLSGLLETRCRIIQELNGSVLSADSRHIGQDSLKRIESILAEKIKSTGTLFLLCSAVTHQPLIECFNETDDFRAYLFSSMEKAEAYQKRRLAAGYDAMIAEVITGKKRAEFYTALMLAGVNFIMLDADDNSFLFPLKMVTSVPIHDGFRGLKNPLQNRKLNALLSDYCQRAEAGTMTHEFEVIILKALKEVHFIAPIHGAEDVDTGEHKEISFNYLIGQRENEDGVQELIGFAFTDNFQLEDWQRQHGYPEQGAICTFAGLFDVLCTYRLKYFILNAGTHTLILDSAAFAKIQNL